MASPRFKKTGVAGKRPELLRKRRGDLATSQRVSINTPVSAQPQQLHKGRAWSGRGRVLRSLAPENKTTEKIWATAASVLIAWTVLPFYSLQLLFWIVGLASLGLEAVPIADIFLPGTEVFVFTYILIALIGVCSMLYGIWIYTIRGVRCFAGARGLMFACCMTGYLVFFLNLFPWIILWMFAVIYTNTDEEPVE